MRRFGAEDTRTRQARPSGGRRPHRPEKFGVRCTEIPRYPAEPRAATVAHHETHTFLWRAESRAPFRDAGRERGCVRLLRVLRRRADRFTPAAAALPRGDRPARLPALGGQRAAGGQRSGSLVQGRTRAAVRRKRRARVRTRIRGPGTIRLVCAGRDPACGALIDPREVGCGGGTGRGRPGATGRPGGRVWPSCRARHGPCHHSAAWNQPLQRRARKSPPGSAWRCSAPASPD